MSVSVPVCSGVYDFDQTERVPDLHDIPVLLESFCMLGQKSSAHRPNKAACLHHYTEACWAKMYKQVHAPIHIDIDIYIYIYISYALAWKSCRIIEPAAYVPTIQLPKPFGRTAWLKLHLHTKAVVVY